MSKEKSLPEQIAIFVRFHLADRYVFAPFTGQDYSAWHAFLYAAQLYGRGDENGQACALDVMRACLNAAQRKPDVLAIFKKSIPGVLDWGFERTLWSLVAPGLGVNALSPCHDGARICSHARSKPSKKHAGHFVCCDPTCKAEWRYSDEKAS